ncbi:MAG: DUF4173 domain-containing protein [Clostridiales Family XIII bacterium]|jgi:hypothetical protein|nr:DUF4173 domain-containing protein [Clostridiales Family XIII bacterium]
MNMINVQTPRVYENAPQVGKDVLAFVNADKALVPGMFICGFFYWEWIASRYMPALGVSLFAILTCGITLIYFNKKGIRQSRTSLPYLLILCLSCVQFTVFDTNDLQFFNIMFITFVYMYWISVSCGTRLSSRAQISTSASRETHLPDGLHVESSNSSGSPAELSGYALFDMVNQCILIPLSNFTAIFVGFHRSLREIKKGAELVYAILGMIVFLPLLAFVIVLLTGADDAFASLWSALWSNLYLSDFVSYIFEFLWGIPIAAYLYGAVYGNAVKRRIGGLDANAIAGGAARARFVPNMAFCAPLAVFNAFYALFFIALGNYFFSAFFSRLPEAVSYAEYARKGFFELCGVAAINLAIIALVYLLVKRNGNARPRGLRFMTGLMSAFTVLLIITAMSKMLMYISAYGLTRLRVYTSWFMLLMLIAFLLLMIWHFRTFKPIKPLIVVFAIGFMVLTWANTDGMIAKYNIWQYESGKVETLDVSMLESLSDAAVPHMFAAWKKESGSSFKDAQGDALPYAETERLEAEWEENPDARLEQYQVLLTYVQSAYSAEADARVRTRLALEEAIIEAGIALRNRTDYSEWNLQSLRVQDMCEEVSINIINSLSGENK